MNAEGRYVRIGGLFSPTIHEVCPSCWTEYTESGPCPECGKKIEGNFKEDEVEMNKKIKTLRKKWGME